MQRITSLLFLALLGLTACIARSTFAARQNIVLVVTDDQGQDAGCYGNPVIKTPHLDALAAEGTRFTNAYCTTASCSPSRSVILTGLYNHANGMYGLEHGYNHFRAFNDLKTLPTLLSAAGYRTARAGKFHVSPEPTFHFEQVIPGQLRRPVQMAKNCRKFIEADSERPFFLYFCTSDPHRVGAVVESNPLRPDSFGNLEAENEPSVEYDPNDVIVPPFLPDTPACRAELAQYYQAVSRADAALGQLVDILKRAGKYENTLIIYISDNGIPFPGAKTTVYEPGIRLPCVVRDPRITKRGVVCNAMISWVDITPTILDFAVVHQPRKRPMHGRSFLPVLEQTDPEGWDKIHASHTCHEVTMYYPMRVVRSGRYKLIWNVAHELPFPIAQDLFESATWQDALTRGLDFKYGQRTMKAYIERPEFELYDIEADPNETHNLAEDNEHTDTLVVLKQELREFQQSTSDPWQIKWQHQ